MRPIALLVAVLAALLTIPMPSTAQTDFPYIIDFELVPDAAYSVNDIESGDATATLQWTVANLGDNQLVVEQLIINTWQPLTFSTDLRPADNRPINLQHPLNYGAPTYRLSIVDATGAILDQRIDQLAYKADGSTPTINAFTAGVATDDRLTVSWAVSSRQPLTNLVFEQVLTDGTVISVELPRDFVWIPSVGQGDIAPQPVADGEAVRLRLRVISALDNSTLTQRDLVIGGPDEATILTFTATPNPVDRDGTVTVTWEVINAEIVQLAQVDNNGRYIRSSEEINLSGERTFSPLASDYYTATFFIYAGDRAGNGATQTLEISVNCTLTFFAASDALTSECPMAAPAEFPGAYQLFERGEAIWRSDRNEIVVLFNDGTYLTFEDTYVEGEDIPLPDGIDVPEPIDDNDTRAVPIRGFGKVWANNVDVRNGLGFSIGDEVGYTITGQTAADIAQPNDRGLDFFTFPDNSVVELSPDGTWRKLPAR